MPILQVQSLRIAAAFLMIAVDDSPGCNVFLNNPTAYSSAANSRSTDLGPGPASRCLPREFTANHREAGQLSNPANPFRPTCPPIQPPRGQLTLPPTGFEDEFHRYSSQCGDCLRVIAPISSSNSLRRAFPATYKPLPTFTLFLQGTDPAKRRTYLCRDRTHY